MKAQNKSQEIKLIMTAKAGMEVLIEHMVLSLEKPTTHETQPYDIISIDGMPFYKSSGNHSNYANTWFPFFGIFENEKFAFFCGGWFIKAAETKLPANVITKMTELFPSYAQYDSGRQLLVRFWNVPCLLLSSSIGGGLWEDERGKKLKQFLEEKFPDYYQKIPSLNILPTSQTLTTISAGNAWLCQRAKCENYLELDKMFVKAVDDLFARLAPLYKPIEAVVKKEVPLIVTPKISTPVKTPVLDLSHVAQKLRLAKPTLIEPALEEKACIEPVPDKPTPVQKTTPNSKIRFSFFSLPAFVLAIGMGAILSWGLGVTLAYALLGGMLSYGGVSLIQALVAKPDPMQTLASISKAATSTQTDLGVNQTSTWLPLKNKPVGSIVALDVATNTLKPGMSL